MNKPPLPLIVGIAGLLVVLLGAGGYIWWQRQQAVPQTLPTGDAGTAASARARGAAGTAAAGNPASDRGRRGGFRTRCSAPAAAAGTCRVGLVHQGRAVRPAGPAVGAVVHADRQLSEPRGGDGRQLGARACLAAPVAGESGRRPLHHRAAQRRRMALRHATPTAMPQW